jgi:hypothetical protein
MNRIIIILIIILALYLIIKLIQTFTTERYTFYDVPDDLVKRYWQRYPQDRYVNMNY